MEGPTVMSGQDATMFVLEHLDRYASSSSRSVSPLSSWYSTDATCTRRPSSAGNQ